MSKAAFFDYVAQGSDADMTTPDFGERMKQLKERLGELRGLTVLEPGCGAGPLTRHLAGWVGPDGRVDAVDISGEMLNRCASRLQGVNWVRLWHGPVEEFPAPPSHYDLILCFRVLPHLGDIPVALRLFRAALKPSGRLLIVHLEGTDRLNAYHASVRCDEIANDVFPAREVLERWIATAGFVVRQWTDRDDDLFIESLAVPADRPASQLSS